MLRVRDSNRKANSQRQEFNIISNIEHKLLNEIGKFALHTETHTHGIYGGKCVYLVYGKC